MILEWEQGGQKILKKVVVLLPVNARFLEFAEQ